MRLDIKKLRNPKKEINLHAHHPNYNETLSVIWVCPQCHKDIHYPNKKHPSKKEYIKKSPYKKHHKKFQPAPKRDIFLLKAKGLKNLGKSYGEIGKELNISKGTIYKWLNEVFYS